MSILRRDARKLSSDGARMGASVLGGQLIKEGDSYLINKTDIVKLLETMLEKNVVLVLGQVDIEKEERVRSCLTCGRDYNGTECSHCANVRSRLRGTRRN